MKVNKKCLVRFSVVFLALLVCGCTAKDSIAKSLPSPTLSMDDFTISSYNVDIEDGYFWLLCAEKKYYYTAGIQEQMDDASRTIKVYSFDPDTEQVEEVSLPYGDGWHLYNMVPAGDGGFWMVFTHLTPNSMLNYTPMPALLVKTDEKYQELFSIDMSEYTQELVSIMGVSCPKSSEYAQESMESLGYMDIASEHFFKAALACDDDGRVYITSVHENVIVFDKDGTYLGEYDTFDVNFSAGVYLVKSSSGEIVVARDDGEHNVKFVVLNVDDFTHEKTFERASSETNVLPFTPMPSLLDDFDVFGGNYYGLFGINFRKDGSYTSTPLFYYGDIGMPQDVYGKIDENDDKSQLVFEHWSDIKQDGTKEFNFYVLSMRTTS